MTLLRTVVDVDGIIDRQFARETKLSDRPTENNCWPRGPRAGRIIIGQPDFNEDAVNTIPQFDQLTEYRNCGQTYISKITSGFDRPPCYLPAPSHAITLPEPAQPAPLARVYATFSGLWGYRPVEATVRDVQVGSYIAIRHLLVSHLCGFISTRKPAVGRGFQPF